MVTGSQLGTVGLLVVFPVLAAILGAVLAASRPPRARLTSGVQHFAASAVLTAIALDALPGPHRAGHLGIATAGFAPGAAILLGLRQVEAHGGTESSGQQPAGLPLGLLVEAHETVDPLILADMFFIGFLTLYILDASH